MKKHQNGFSLIELLIVVAVIGVVATLAVPALQKGIRAAENGNAFGTMRTVASAQVGYFQSNGRFARITEINNAMSGNVGSNSGNDVVRGKWIFSMRPSPISDAELRDGYVIQATRTIAGEGITYTYELTQDGQIRQILPVACDGMCN